MEVPDLNVRPGCAAAADDPYVRRLRALAGASGTGGPVRAETEREREQRLANVASNLLKEAVFAQVLRHLRDHGIEDVAPLKGMYLLRTLYRDCPGLRPMADVDVLVRRSDFGRARRAMARLGRVGVSDPRRPLLSAFAHEFPCRVGPTETVVEVHRGQTPLDLFELDYGALLDEAESVEVGDGARMLLMPLAQATAFQVFHDLSDGLASAMPLTWQKVAQVHVLVHNAGVEPVREACTRFGIGHFLDLYLHVLAQVFASVPPPEGGAAWHAHVRRGHLTPFEYAHGELAYRARLFRGALLKKVAPRLLTSPVDLALRPLRVGPDPVGARAGAGDGAHVGRERLRQAALLWTGGARVALWLLPWPWVRSLLERLARPTAARRAPPPTPAAVAAAVGAAARGVPRSTCLVQALATHALLRRAGVESKVVLGVEPQRGDAFQAHAWVESGGEVVVGGDVTNHAALGSLTAGGADALRGSGRVAPVRGGVVEDLEAPPSR